MTERIYKKQLIDTWKGIMQIVRCTKCRKKCTDDEKLLCAIEMEKKHRKGEWTFEIGLEREKEIERGLKCKTESKT